MSTGKSKYHVSKWPPIPVSETLLQDACKLFGENDSAVFASFEMLASPGTTENQIQTLKSIAKLYTQGVKLQEETHKRFLISLLTAFYLKAQPKNPMKSAAAKLFLTFPAETHDDIARNVSEGLVQLIRATKDGDYMSLHSTTNIINSCFDNFSIGVTAVNGCLRDVLHFLSECLQRYVLALSLELPPTIQMEVCQYAHSITQVLVTVLQKCQANVRQIVAESGTSVFSHLLKCSTTILSLDDIPMDTTTNCGLLVVLLVGLLEKEEGLLKLASSSLPAQLEGTNVNYSTPTCRLNICMGLLNTLTLQQQSLLVPDTATPVITSILGQLLSLSDTNSSESSFVLCVNRAMILLTRNLCHMTALPSDAANLTRVAEEDVVAMVMQCLPFAWTHLDHYMDSIRHAARNILQNLVSAGVSLKHTCILSKILNDVVSISPQKKSKYVGLTILAKETDCQTILDKIPDLVASLLAAVEDLTIQNHVACTMEAFIARQHVDVPLPRWIERWIRPVVRAYGTTVNGGPCLENVLATALALCPSCLSSLQAHDTPLKVTLACIKIGRRKNKLSEGAAENGNGSMWKGLIAYETLEEALFHQDQEVRMSALSLVVESRKSTEPFSAAELQLVRTALTYNVNVEEQAAQQQTLAYVKQMLARFNEGAVAMRRREAKKKERGEEKHTGDSTALDHYAAFSSWLVSWCFSCLFPGANIGRRSMALTVLTLSVEYLRGETVGADLWTLGNADVLLETLKDTYESNKMLAYKLLITFPAAKLRFDDVVYVKQLVSVCLQLVSSNRPPDCVTASYLLKALAQYPQSAHALSEMLSDRPLPTNQDAATLLAVNLLANHLEAEMLSDRPLPTNQDAATLLAVNLLANHLEAELSVAKRSLLIAAASGPMYGSLFCIRALLQDVNMKDIGQQPDWQRLFKRLVALCFVLTDTVAPVVNNSSPEGHLPMDFQPVTDGEGGGGDGAPVTAQMVLLCAWRTVKEAALFLGDVSQHAPISDAAAGVSGLVTEDDLLAIGDHLTSLLSETKHRGAFEQAYVGFCQLSARLWSDATGRLHRIPAVWLDDTLLAIESGEKLCATRRGAGLPYIVQALLTTELSTGLAPRCLHPAMTQLLLVATRGATIDTRTNALNILRALFRHTQLGDLVTPHVAQGVQVAIAGFKRNAWAERNSATLLFSALVTRMFGVRRHRELLGSKDRMTGRVFFARYPALYQTLCTELAQTGEHDCHADSRYPALLLLARLYPSALEGTDAQLQLSVFIPLVQECATSRVLKTRVLAAKALVPLITPNIYVATLRDLFNTVARSRSENHRHGCMLQILHLLAELPPSLSGAAALTDQVQHWIQSACARILSSRNYLLMQVYAQVLRCLVRDCFSSVATAVWHDVGEKIWKTFQTDESNGKVDYKLGRSVYEESATELLLNIDLTSLQEPIVSSAKTATLCSTIRQLLQLPSYEIVKVTLDFLVNLFTGGHSDVPQAETKLGQNETLVECLSDSIDLSDVLLRHVNNENNYFYECRWKVFQVLCHLPKVLLKLKSTPVEVLEYLLEVCNKEDESVSFAVIKCLSTVVSECRQANDVVYTDNVWLDFAATILSFTTSDRSVACRLAAAAVLVEQETLFGREGSNLADLALSKLWTAAVALHLDADSSVRARVSATSVMPQRALEVLLQRFTRDIATDGQKWQCWATCLLAWGLQGLTLEASDDEQQECLFDRGEVNPYAEEALLTDLACKQLSTVPFARISTLDLPPELGRWLVGETLPACNSDLLPSNLKEFVDLVELKSNTVSLQGLIVTTDVSHFLVPEHKYKLLNAYKMKKVLAVVQHGL